MISTFLSDVISSLDQTTEETRWFVGIPIVTSITGKLSSLHRLTTLFSEALIALIFCSKLLRNLYYLLSEFSFIHCYFIGILFQYVCWNLNINQIDRFYIHWLSIFNFFNSVNMSFSIHSNIHCRVCQTVFILLKLIYTIFFHPTSQKCISLPWDIFYLYFYISLSLFYT